MHTLLKTIRKEAISIEDLIKCLKDSAMCKNIHITLDVFLHHLFSMVLKMKMKPQGQQEEDNFPRAEDKDGMSGVSKGSCNEGV